ncbi:MAG TPA: DUF1428 domain-containing protein [Actinomycetota bacterium]|nr:DUF1428 domain-containing protein [Actinomycetota bacterium]
MGYVDLYLLPFPKKNLDRYKDVANKFGRIARECGALGYREFLGEDLSPEGVLPFTKAAPIGDGEVLSAAIVEYESRAHRDEVMKKIFADPRMEEMKQDMNPDGDPVADMSKMYYGGFETFVEV